MEFAEHVTCDHGSVISDDAILYVGLLPVCRPLPAVRSIEQVVRNFARKSFSVCVFSFY